MSSEVPDGWRVTPFSEAVAINPKRRLAREGLVPFLDMANLPLDGADVSVLEAREVGNSGSKFQASDTLFARITPCAENGKLGYVHSIDGGAVAQGSTEFIVMAARDGLTLPEYVRYLAAWSKVRDQAIGLMEGTSGRQRVPNWAFDEIEILIPPLDEQERIVGVLRSVDDAVQSAHAAAEQCARCLSANLANLMDHSNEEHRGWAKGRCDSFFELQRGFDITESQAQPGSHKVISSSGPSYTHSEARVEGPAVVTGRKGRLGAVFYSEQACWPHDTTLWVRDFKGNQPRFVFWKLRSMKLETLDAATSVPTLNRNNVHALSVWFPDLKRQVEISEILDTNERALLAQRAQAEALKSVRARLHSDLLSGRVRVPA